MQSVIFGNVIRIIGGIKLPSQTAAIAFRRLLQYVSKLNMRIGKEPVRGFTTHWIKGVLQKQNKREILKIKSEKKAAEKGLQKMGKKRCKNSLII